MFQTNQKVFLACPNFNTPLGVFSVKVCFATQHDVFCNTPWSVVWHTLVGFVTQLCGFWNTTKAVLDNTPLCETVLQARLPYVCHDVSHNHRNFGIKVAKGFYRLFTTWSTISRAPLPTSSTACVSYSRCGMLYMDRSLRTRFGSIVALSQATLQTNLSPDTLTIAVVVHLI